ncbi:phospho-2-dehydro-3-deoxyheptonate aldolase [Bifidobacterium pseudolongum subsp. globosum]|uniref:Phospho-2-dehydro-3-deoxyheptonate aldolase n=1 Tax=Bifidobacterium pseudolongum subsp. globosum TaxID=1690 RepID=A0A2N3QYI2_9BIFI|nr:MULTISPECIES: 3-deoxy-7-phosphoheptulonate synthase [Bifidobacterium]MCI6773311.1 3-deoxy-7-phosphoheptulonate synthase [Bifidobacterium pseudolongum]ATO40461.1 3-deoxy-7-phosphoheptulonate synthase [Bifidobacterium pseudolongum subsp. globosum DSM 20092]KFI76923.1 phospho-2-dehydro-3-deoxyheptonate aldolase [Bifidobacterium pseudolongum subsp. globosum]MBQ1599603.1 3-deoxy-7-phosphoheptulonate synthase [Bifidobacterium sp.]MEE1201569.1 3-deoxy-7-phosphoheptulonate synthase [Bifidobacterium
MTALRGPDSSQDALLDEHAVVPETVDVNIRQLDPIPAPRYFIKELPLTDAMRDLVLDSRSQIRDVLHGRDDRLLAIVGPCSIHDPKAAHDYAMRLAALNRELGDRLLIVMRVYFEKPRTTIGWKGLINDPDLNGRFDIRKGMWLARKVLTDVLSLGLPAATEWLDPITPQYLCDLISWGAIGARNTESQVHRELASGMSMPIGFKNATDGSIKPAADSCFSAANEHHFLSINLDGQVISAETKGNPDCHLVLRGSSAGPNYDPVSVARALDDLKASKAAGPSDHGLIIDAAHGNCGKDEVVEAQVIEDIASRVAAGERGILGIMMESFLVGGHQDPAPLDQLVYGQSVTDACVPWDRTEQVLRKLADAVATRRAAAE